MPAFGAKVVKDFVADIEAGNSDVVDLRGNASLRMKPAENLAEIVCALKKDTKVTKLDVSECELPDDACNALGDLFRNNSTILEVVLEKNKISSHGAKVLAQGLAENKGIRTLNLLQQAVKSFGDDCLDSFVLMYATNITLTKLTWRLDSRKSFSLAKLQTRNIEIQKRIANGKDFNDLLPDNLKSGGAPVAGEAAPAEAAVKRATTVEDMDAHLKEVEQHLPEDAVLHEGDEEEEKPAEVEVKPEEVEVKPAVVEVES